MWIFGIFFFFASSSFEIKRKKTGENSNTVWKVSVCIELYELIGSFRQVLKQNQLTFFSVFAVISSNYPKTDPSDCRVKLIFMS